jgi:hypothetical protein
MYESRSFDYDAVSHYTFYERRPRKNENNIESCFYMCLRLRCRPAIPKLCDAAPRNISKYWLPPIVCVLFLKVVRTSS